MDEPNRDIILKSPTGSGKTIILTYFMHQYIPRKHFLPLQNTLKKNMEQAATKLKIKRVYNQKDLFSMKK